MTALALSLVALAAIPAVVWLSTHLLASDSPDPRPIRRADWGEW